jgi:hypothetical protein
MSPRKPVPGAPVGRKGRGRRTPRTRPAPCGDTPVDSPQTVRVVFGGRWRSDGALDRHVAPGSTITPLTAADHAAVRTCEAAILTALEAERSAGLIGALQSSVAHLGLIGVRH